MTIRNFAAISVFATVGFSLPVSAMYVEVDNVAYEISASRGSAYVTSLSEESHPESPKYEGEVEIPSVITVDDVDYGVIGIGVDTFAGCAGLLSVKLPESLLSIGDYAFSDCVALREIVIPSGVTSIGVSSFSGCSSLEAVVIPTGVSSLGSRVFYNCGSLERIELPASLRRIGESAFSLCRSLRSVDMPQEMAQIDSRAFRGCSSLTEVVMPLMVNTVGEGVFQECSSLETVEWENMPDCIPAYLFANCKSLREVFIPEKTRLIGAYAYQGCTSLKKVELPESLTIIEEGAFSLCTSLLEVVFGAEPDDTASEGMRYTPLLQLGNRSFAGCQSLCEAFLYGVEAVGDESFDGCSALEAVVFDKRTGTIGSRAFRNCPSLIRIFATSDNPPVLSNVAFDREAYASVDLYTPVSAESLYKQTAPWSNFMRIYGTEDSPSGIGGGLVDDEDEMVQIVTHVGEVSIVGMGLAPVSVYSLDGQLLYSSENPGDSLTVQLPGGGVYIVRVGDDVRKVML